MRFPKTLALSIASIAFLCALPAGADDKKIAVDKSVASRLISFDQDTKVDGETECKIAFKKAAHQLRATYENCLQTPPVGSPLDKFNKLPNVQLAQFCGNKTLQQCADDVTKDQADFCKAKMQPALDALKQKKQLCLECDAINQQLEALVAQARDLEKQLSDKGCPLTRRILTR